MSQTGPSMSSEGETGQTGELGQNIRDMGQQVKEAAREQMGRIRDSAGEYYETGREKALEWEHRFEDYVREQPVKSMLIAAGVGLFLGVLWRRS